MVPIVMNFSSWPVPLAALMYRSKLPLRREGQRIRRPSGDQIGRLSTARSNVMREGTPRTKSKTQTSAFASSARSNAMLFSSGDNRKARYSAAAAATPSGLPLDRPRAAPGGVLAARHVGQRAVLRNGESVDGFGDRKHLTRQCDRVRIEWLRHQRRFAHEQQVAASAGHIGRDICRGRAVGQKPRSLRGILQRRHVDAVGFSADSGHVVEKVAPVWEEVRLEPRLPVDLLRHVDIGHRRQGRAGLAQPDRARAGWCHLCPRHHALLASRRR